jgi:hypothetical protein
MSARTLSRRARRIVATHSPAEVLCIHARAEDDFDFLFADALYEAVKEASEREVRFRLTELGAQTLEAAG